SRLATEEKYFKNPYLPGNLTLYEREILNKHISKDSVSNKQLLLALYELSSLDDYAEIKMEITEYESETTIQLIKKESPIIKTTDLIGSSAINSERTGEIFSSLTGQHYSGRRILTTLIELLKEYRKVGYSLANISEITFDKENGQLGIFVDEGIISKIITEGNDYTNPSIITREFPIYEGDFFNIDKISEGLINLRGTRLFDDAEVILKKENGKNILVIKVVERPTSLLRLGFNVNNENRARIAADLREENLFGSGSELGLLFHTSSRDRGIQLEQKSNRLFNTYLTYKIRAFYYLNDLYVYGDKPQISENSFSREEIGEYRQVFFGGSLGVGAQVERFGNLIFEGKYQINEVKNINESPVEQYNRKIVSFKISTTVDTQDKYPYPERGIYFNGFYETAQTFLGGDVGYTNVSFEYRNLLRLSSVSVLSAGINMGFGDKTLPLAQQYSLGGMNSFFGMHDNEYRGRQIFLTSLMYRLKLPFAIFFDTYFRIRYDLGNVWEIQEQIKFKNLKHGVGTALSFDTPIGPAEFAVGRSFLFRRDIPDNPISWGDLQFYFSIGYYY
ncbi:MAG: BamA/TamA family outer membrane protein, partial [Ignavibacteriaceae bacterium]|nr:BamA/TamA family outer membrane protein [Ignavibacteriaceae bacterium]